MIKLICIGKIKKDYLKDAISDYIKRISKYSKIEIIELNDYNILLDINSNELSSVEFAKKIMDVSSINSNITFIIGGSYGLYEEIKDKCDYMLSFSKLTFPHQLFRVMLLEQIYRSFKIINNEEYHK